MHHRPHKVSITDELNNTMAEVEVGLHVIIDNHLCVQFALSIVHDSMTEKSVDVGEPMSGDDFDGLMYDVDDVSPRNSYVMYNCIMLRCS